MVNTFDDDAGAAPVNLADVFDMATVKSALQGIRLKGQISLLDATQNVDGSYTVSNNDEVWAGPLSGVNEGGSDGFAGNSVLYFNPNTGVIQMQFGGTTPNGVPGQNGEPQGEIQGQIVGWTGDSFLIKLYGNLNTQTGQLSDPLTPSDGPTGQAAYVVMSAEDMTGTKGIPTSGAMFGQPTDPATQAGLTNTLGVYPPIPAAPVDASGAVDAIGENLSTGFAGWVAVAVNGDGTYSATMGGGSYQSLDAFFQGWGLIIVSAHPGGILEIGLATSPGGGLENDLGFGQIIGWNADGILLRMYFNYADGTLSNLLSGSQQFLFISGNDLAGTTIPADAPEVFGQDPSDFPPGFGIAPSAPPPTGPTPVIDPSSITALNSITFDSTHGGGQLATGHIVLADAAQNADGSYTLSLNEPWAGSIESTNEYFNGGNVGLSVTVGYSNATTGSVEFSFTAASGQTLPTVLSGEFFGKIVAWDGSEFLIQLYRNLDMATGVLSNPVDPSQGPAFMLISSYDYANPNVNGDSGSGVLDGKTMGQPTDSSTQAALQTGLGIGDYAPPSTVDLSGLPAALTGKSSDFGAFVKVTNLGGGNYSATDTYHPSPIYTLGQLPYYYAPGGYADFTETGDGADAAPGFTIKIDNVFSGGVFEWELDNPNPPPTYHINQNPTGPETVDHFFAKVIGYNADGILVQDYTTYSNGQLSGLVGGVQEYAYFSTNDLANTNIQDTPAQLGNDPSQLPNGLGVTGASSPPPPPPSVNLADVFDMSTVANALQHIGTKGQISLLDATLNADGTYTVFNGNEVWAGPLSGPSQGIGDGLAQNIIRYFNPYTGVIQIQLGGSTPNGVPAQNGWPQGYIQGQIVGWNGDSFLIKLYGNLDTQTGQLSDPLTSSADQAAYVVMSAEDMNNTTGIPTSGAMFGQPTDSGTLAGLSSSLGVYPTIPAAPVDASGAVDAIGENLSTGFAGWVAVTVNGDGTYNATMSGVSLSASGGYESLAAVYQGWGLDIVSAHPGGILEIGLTFSPGGSFDQDLGYGQIIGWNGDGILLRMYSTYSDGVLSDLKSGSDQFLFISANDLTGTTITPDAPQVFGQDPSDFPPGFGIAPPPPPSTGPAPVIDPGTLVGLNSITFDFAHGGGGLTSGRIVLADATQNGDGSYTLSLNEPWAGSIEPTSQYFNGGNVGLSVAVGYSDAATGAVEFSFTAASGQTLPTLLGGEFFGKIVAWDGSDILIQLYRNLDMATGVLSNPVDPSQGPAYMVISSYDYANPNVNGDSGSGVLDGKTMGQPTDSSTQAALQTGLGIGDYAPPSTVDLSGLPAALTGKSSDFGAFVKVTNLGGGNYSATDTYHPSPIYTLGQLPYYYAPGGYADFTETGDGADAAPGFTIKIDNVFSGGVFEWELDNPNPPPTYHINQNPTGPETVDHFFAKVIGYNADGILVQDYTTYSNGQLSGLVGGVQEYAYFSTNDLADTDIQGTPAQFGNDPSQLPNGLGVTAPCFAEGTRIRTARGDVPVEQLREGDDVVTASGALRPVKWIGHRHVDCTRHQAPAKVWPVRVAAGAFGPSLPSRDLFLSPDHALFVEGALIPVKQLINDDTIAQTGWSDVTYYHVELDRHDVLLAEGLPAESFLDTGNRDSFANGGPVMRLHADFAPDWYSMAWEAKACAQLVLRGAQVEAAKAQLRHHAAAKPARRRVMA